MNTPVHIENCAGQYLSSPRAPATILLQHAAKLACNCAIYTGLRTDNWDPVTVAIPCNDGHSARLEHTARTLETTLANPPDQPLITIVAALLNQTTTTPEPAENE